MKLHFKLLGIEFTNLNHLSLLKVWMFKFCRVGWRFGIPK